MYHFLYFILYKIYLIYMLNEKNKKATINKYIIEFENSENITSKK